MAEGHPPRRTTAASASPTSGTWAGCTTRWLLRARPGAPQVAPPRPHVRAAVRVHRAVRAAVSHDEVVHGKGACSTRCPATSGSASPTCGRCTAWMWAYPGAPLLFMGGEMAPWTEWNERRASLALRSRRAPPRRPRPGADLNRVAAEWPALWERDHEPTGFQWLDADDADHSVFAFLRWGRRAPRWWPASPTSRRCRGRATASACRGPASGRCCSTRTPPTSAARARAGARAAWAATTSRTRASRPRRSSPAAAGGALARLAAPRDGRPERRAVVAASLTLGVAVGVFGVSFGVLAVAPGYRRAGVRHVAARVHRRVAVRRGRGPRPPAARPAAVAAPAPGRPQRRLRAGAGPAPAGFAGPPAARRAARHRRVDGDGHGAARPAEPGPGLLDLGAGDLRVLERRHPGRRVAGARSATRPGWAWTPPSRPASSC